MSDQRPTFVTLTEREKDVLVLLAEGLSDNQIGERLNISYKTVNYHVENIKRRLRAANRTHAVALALRRGEID